MKRASEQEWRRLFNNGLHNYAVIKNERYKNLPAFLRSRVQDAGKYGDYRLLRDSAVMHPESSANVDIRQKG